MSYSSSSLLKSGVKFHHVVEFVQQLDYHFDGILRPSQNVEEFGSEGIGDLHCFSWYDTSDYRSWTGVELSIYKKGPQIIIETRTPIARSYYDLEHQNRTIKLLRRHFGGSFHTDEGAGRYLKPDADPPTPAASGCHIAFQRFGSNLIKCVRYFESRDFAGKRLPSSLLIVLDSDPWFISNNVIIPFLLAILEDYWKSTYVALLRHSERKEAILRPGRLNSGHLATISSGFQAVEQAFSEGLSFQNLPLICRNFNALDAKIDFAAVLRKPYRRRKMSLYQSLEALTEIRHNIIHRAKLDLRLTDGFVYNLLHDAEVSVDRCYRHLTETYKWNYDKGWGISWRRSNSFQKDLVLGSAFTPSDPLVPASARGR